jgi:hypothetical protein
MDPLPQESHISNLIFHLADWDLFPFSKLGTRPGGGVRRTNLAFGLSGCCDPLGSSCSPVVGELPKLVSTQTLVELN